MCRIRCKESVGDLSESRFLFHNHGHESKLLPHVWHHPRSASSDMCWTPTRHLLWSVCASWSSFLPKHILKAQTEMFLFLGTRLGNKGYTKCAKLAHTTGMTKVVSSNPITPPPPKEKLFLERLVCPSFKKINRIFLIPISQAKYILNILLVSCPHQEYQQKNATI